MIKDVKIPNNYRGKESKYEGNIAVLTLNEVIIYHNHIAPACLNINAVYGREKLLPRDNTLGSVAGFGQTEIGLPSEVLRIIYLPIVNFDKCWAQADNSFRPFLISDTFCAGFTDGTGYVCKGDSGGGLTFLDKRTNKYYVYGVLSYV